MLGTGLGLGEEINTLDLRWKIVLITNGAASEMRIHTNVLGQLMLDRISSNLKGSSTVIMKRYGRGNQC